MGNDLYCSPKISIKLVHVLVIATFTYFKSSVGYHSLLSRSTYNDSLGKFYSAEYREPLKDLCTDTKLRNLIGCCNSVVYLENVMIHNKSIIVYLNSNDSNNNNDHHMQIDSILPNIFQNYFNRIWYEKMNMHIIRSPFPEHKCNFIFEGTLHISGRKSIHNLFHLMNDNILPLITQIVLDRELSLYSASLPRMSLSFFHLTRLFKDIDLKSASNSYYPGSVSRYKRKADSFPAVGVQRGAASRSLRTSRNNNNNNNNNIKKSNRTSSRENHRIFHRKNAPTAFPHLELYRKLFDAGEIPLEQAEGVCFRRVVWGTGLRLHYVDAMVTLRRLTADFIREFVTRHFHLALPDTFSEAAAAALGTPIKLGSGAARSWSLVRDGRRLRVLLLSRGQPGGGHSVLRDQLLGDLLKEAGALVHRCCGEEEQRNLSLQLRPFLHADVVVGVHGAGLVNTIFSPRGVILVELKPLQGFTSDVYLHTSDSRAGYHVHIDIRNAPQSRISKTLRAGSASAKEGDAGAGRRRQTTENVARRILVGIKRAVEESQSSGGIGRILRISEEEEDYLVGPSPEDGDLSGILGPPRKTLNETCRERLAFARYREEVLRGSAMEHCQSCPRDSDRFF